MKFPLMIKSVSEAVETVEERQGVPSEKALKGHVAHLVTRLRFKGHRSALRIRPKRSTVGSVQLSDVSSKPRARPEPALTAISCSTRQSFSKSLILVPRWWVAGPRAVLLTMHPIQAPSTSRSNLCRSPPVKQPQDHAVRSRSCERKIHRSVAARRPLFCGSRTGDRLPPTPSPPSFPFPFTSSP